MEIIVVNNGELCEMVAPQGYYITQADNAADRIFVRRRQVLETDILAHWRLASEQEKMQAEAPEQNSMVE